MKKSTERNARWNAEITRIEWMLFVRRCVFYAREDMKNMLFKNWRADVVEYASARLNGQCRQHVGAWPQSQMLSAVIVVVVVAVVVVVMRIWWVCLWNCAFGCLLSFLCTLHLCKCCLYGCNATYTMRPRRIASTLWHCMWHNTRNAVNEFFNMIAIRDIIHNCSCAFVWLIWFVIVIIVEPKITMPCNAKTYAGYNMVAYNYAQIAPVSPALLLSLYAFL